MIEVISPPPAPSFLSEAARAGLEVPIVRTPSPALDDHAGWTAMIEETDAMLTRLLDGRSYPMTSELQRLGVVPSFSRPAVSNDNPYSELLFKTLKYRPGYPEKSFGELVDARR